ncbi:hypothetical protein E2C01_016643 [Portunus trituberculatus]|uniref:Uncharacterized protein n=1 Tax=Portunus trituberculatus TaxID=210409 RepID=A0A5B7DRQ4_PORTR|nr:hypothetical protein [Portunus trituberculatus]
MTLQQQVAVTVRQVIVFRPWTYILTVYDNEETEDESTSTSQHQLQGITSQENVHEPKTNKHHQTNN